jgi:anaphase-promoting complex subunit 10
MSSVPGTPPDASSPEAADGGGGGDQKGSKSLKELGSLAAWSVTSAKPGNGVELLRDGSKDTYWQ